MKFGATWGKAETRLSSLQTGSDAPLGIEWVWVINAGDVGLVEGTLHAFWRCRARVGEWFSVSAGEVAALSIELKYDRRPPDIPHGFNPAAFEDMRRIPEVVISGVNPSGGYYDEDIGELFVDSLGNEFPAGAKQT